MFAGQRGQRAVRPGVDLEVDAVADVRLHRRAPAIRGQIDLVGNSRQLTRPVLDLPSGQRFRVRLVTEDRALPQAVVGVLHRQRRPRRGCAAGSRDVGAGEVPRERAERHPVGGNVVDHHRQGEVVVREPEEPVPDRHLLADVEPPGGEFGQGRVQFGHIDQLHCERSLHRGEVEHHLMGVAVGLREDGTQDLMPREDVVQRSGQRGDVDPAPHPEHEGQVVRRRLRIELVQEPDPLLGEGERDPLRASLRHERGPIPATRLRRLDQRGEVRHRRRLEQGTDAQRGVERVTEPRNDLRGDQRVAAESEEVVVGTDAFDPEDVGEHTRHDLLDRSGRDAEPAGLEHRFGQRSAVELAVGGERELLEHRDRVRHHVLRQPGAERVLDGGDLHGLPRQGNHVRDESLTQRVLVEGHDGLGDLRLVRQRGLDLAQLDPQTPDLDLVVGPADVHEFAGGVPGHEVTRAVHPLSRRERVRHEPLRRQVRPRHVPARELDAREIQLARNPHRNRPQPGVEHVHPGVPHRRTDRHLMHVHVGDLVEGHVDGGLGGAVQVVHRDAGDEAAHPGGDGRRQRLTRGENQAQRPQVSGIGLGHEHRQHRRHKVQHRHPGIADQPRKGDRIAVHVRRGHNQSGTDLQRPEQLPHRHIERKRSLLQHHVRIRQTVLTLHPQQPVDDRRMRHRDTLGPPGRTRRENHVRRVGTTQRCRAFRVHDRCVGPAGHVEGVDRHDGPPDAREALPLGGEDHHRRRRAEDVLGALRRLVRIDRHVSTAGGHDRIHADQQIRRPPHRQSDERVRSDPPLDQVSGQAMHPRGELPVAEGVAVEHHRVRIRAALDLRLEQRHQGRVPSDGAIRRVPLPHHQGLLGRVQ
ncbi:hypothetical protein RAJCM14343_5281 [Rhodococcus aetherivorans]|uniref:Uncharacterized protein n=1 Tax=Rhodococcus aetherivorans TaxID=191292 RepID=A0ABQ0YU41_9NOCA|nr:hypothetical protein RAJCM14343_5281 [Rhodococcus aetherivorans]